MLSNTRTCIMAGLGFVPAVLFVASLCRGAFPLVATGVIITLFFLVGYFFIRHVLFFFDPLGGFDGKSGMVGKSKVDL
jgi:hypothetical protein